MVLVPALTQKKGAIGLRMEIVKHMQTFYFSFFNLVCDVILFENEVYILINSVARFDDTLGTFHLSPVTFVSCQQCDRRQLM